MFFVIIMRGLQRDTIFLNLRWFKIEMCVQVDRDHTGQARVLLSGVQQQHSRTKGTRQREGHRCTHPCTAGLLLHFSSEYFTVFIAGKI